MYIANLKAAFEKNTQIEQCYDYYEMVELSKLCRYVNANNTMVIQLSAINIIAEVRGFKNFQDKITMNKKI